MAVETRYVVVRNGEELLSTTDKKKADEYDKMLDMADSLFDLMGNSGLELDESLQEKLSVYLAENKDDVLIALGAKKAKPKPKQKPKAVATEPEVEQDQQQEAA